MPDREVRQDDCLQPRLPPVDPLHGTCAPSMMAHGTTAVSFPQFFTKGATALHAGLEVRQGRCQLPLERGLGSLLYDAHSAC